jgi:hypothetical protein
VCVHTDEQAVVRLARLHRRIRTMRQDVRHTVTTALATATLVLVVEARTVRDLARNGSRSRAMRDGGWGAVRRMQEDTCAWDGAVLRMALRDVPSTTRCARCGRVGPALPRSRRVVPGAACGVEGDRDSMRRAPCAHRAGPTGRVLLGVLRAVTPVAIPLAAKRPARVGLRAMGRCSRTQPVMRCTRRGAIHDDARQNGVSILRHGGRHRGVSRVSVWRTMTTMMSAATDYSMVDTPMGLSLGWGICDRMDTPWAGDPNREPA